MVRQVYHAEDHRRGPHEQNSQTQIPKTGGDVSKFNPERRGGEGEGAEEKIKVLDSVTNVKREWLRWHTQGPCGQEEQSILCYVPRSRFAGRGATREVKLTRLIHARDVANQVYATHWTSATSTQTYQETQKELTDRRLDREHRIGPHVRRFSVAVGSSTQSRWHLQWVSLTYRPPVLGSVRPLAIMASSRILWRYLCHTHREQWVYWKRIRLPAEVLCISYSDRYKLACHHGRQSASNGLPIRTKRYKAGSLPRTPVLDVLFTRPWQARRTKKATHVQKSAMSNHPGEGRHRDICLQHHVYDVFTGIPSVLIQLGARLLENV